MIVFQSTCHFFIPSQLIQYNPYNNLNISNIIIIFDSYKHQYLLMKSTITFCVYNVNNFIYNSILYALPYFQDYLTLPHTSSSTAICYSLHKSSFRTLMGALRCRSHTHSPHIIPHLDAGSMHTHITTLHLATLLPQDSASKR